MRDCHALLFHGILFVTRLIRSNLDRQLHDLAANMVFFLLAGVVFLLIIALAIITLVISVKLGSVHVTVLRKLPGYKPHLLYGNALEMAREPDSENK